MLHKTTDEIWNKFLYDEFNSKYFKKLSSFLSSERELNEIFPENELIFNAFNTTPFDKVKVVIIGQDPYHSIDKKNNEIRPHAHGLSFSVPIGTKKIPPSLKNIFKELNQDLGFEIPVHGDLTHWAKQGVLLLNATLTVRAHEAGSHQKKGWEKFTNSVIEKLSLQKEGVIFLLWGKFAQQKEVLINIKKHHILKAPHPSPFSVFRGFYGCKHFSETNKILTNSGNSEIDWEIK
jgi:uracil-DNA glycosylase